MKKVRFTVMLGDKEIGQAKSIIEIAKLVGCSRIHVYNELKDGYFKFKKNNYQVIDKLD